MIKENKTPTKRKKIAKIDQTYMYTNIYVHKHICTQTYMYTNDIMFNSRYKQNVVKCTISVFM